MNKLIKHNLGLHSVIGVQGDEKFLKEWDILIHNYDIASDIHILSDNFFYFITDKQRFVNMYGLFLQNQYFFHRLCMAGERLIMGRQEAKKFYENIEQESFYNFYRE